MKIKLLENKIFKFVSKNGKPYWAVTEHAYKKEEDKITYFVNFSSKTPEPMAKTATSKSGKEYQYIDIKEADCALGCYNGSPQITIFSYTLNEPEDWDYSNMGGEKQGLGAEIGIESDDLPFYGG